MTSELPKTFDPAEIERRWYEHWEANGLFRPERPEAEPFTIVNPPPNVTGSLHIGHALDNTLQDVVVRYERLRGKDALWVVGTDHAGIATQLVVERQLEERQDKRTNYSREDFVAKVWEWKEESGGTMTRQLRRLGCSMDWSREQFTMDPHFTRAVTKVFVDLYNQGLIYRDKRLVNWDPKLKTAISDLEVETREVKGEFWHFRYPLADGVTTAEGTDHLEVATTRPETMLADMAVAVHPSDARYASVVGKEIVQPITGRRFKVIADEHADPELGSGCVKITPGHDFNDFEVGKRAGFKPAEMLNMFNAEARMVQTADGLIPDEFLGLDRFAARELVVARMKALGCLVPYVDVDTNGDGAEHDSEPRSIPTPFGDRGGVVIEPWLTDQWYVDAETLAQAPIEAVRDGRIEIVPKTWEKTFFNWMENIQPWCVSRQLWWGHRIPAWYWFDKDANNDPMFRPSGVLDVETAHEATVLCKVVQTEQEAREAAAEFYRRDISDVIVVEGRREAIERTGPNNSSNEVAIWQDLDVLDTWFSSALWPFATLGWPDADLPSPQGEGSGEGFATPDPSNPHPPTPSPPGRGSDLLAKHYPNDLLISGFDILFFWDARMAMQGMHLMGEVPWKRLYLHGLVRAADGQKMSKSKGNVVDPLILIDKYGADALRFFMAAMESQGRDVKMDEARVEGYRNFATKLWNAARFCQANGIGASERVAAPPATQAINKWIVGEVAATCDALDKAMADLRFDVAASAIYHFVWDTFCDWYLELIKPVLSPLPLAGGAGGGPVPAGAAAEADTPTPNPSRKREGDEVEETRAVVGWALDQILVMLHPFMPFITEELWHAQGQRPYELIVAKWPEPEVEVALEAKAEVEGLIELVRQIRSMRSEYNVPPSSVVPLVELGAGMQHSDKLMQFKDQVIRLGRVLISGFEAEHRQQADTDSSVIGSSGGIQFSAWGSEYSLLLKNFIDIGAEKARLAKALAASEKEAKALSGRLANANFVERAAPQAVEKARADHAHHAAEAERLRAALARLG